LPKVKKVGLFSHHHIPLLKNTFFISALRAVQLMAGIGSTYVMAHLLSKNLFGQYHFILNCIGLVTLFAMKGLNESVMQSVARGFPGTFRHSIPVAFYWSLLGSVALAGLGSWYLFENQFLLAKGFLIAAVIFPFTHGLTQWKAVRTGREDFIGLLRTDGLASIIMNALMIGAMLLVPDSYIWPLAMLLLIPAIQNILLTLKGIRAIDPNLPAEEGSIAYGVKTNFYSAFNIAAKHIDKLLLFFFLSPVALATFVAADRIVDLLRNFVSDLAAVLAPRFARMKSFTGKLDRIMMWFSIIYGASVMVFAFTLMPWILTFIFGDSYHDAVPYAQALMLSVAFGNSASLRFRFIRSQMDTRGFKHITVYTSVLRIAVSLILIPFWGITGAVISAISYSILTAAVVHVVLRKRYPVHE
jgi:O-antigen/teichoic acid export membrane protein